MQQSNYNWFLRVVNQQNPAAYARVMGSSEYPGLKGTVFFYQVPGGVLVVADVTGLPYGSGSNTSSFYGFHIHEGKYCTGTTQDPFADSGGHYNPNNTRHPEHAGDLPPLLGNSGWAWTAFVTERFTVDDILDHTVIIHRNPDDFTSQPSGNSGSKIACGEIHSYID